MYFTYTKTINDDRADYIRDSRTCLFGCNAGIIPRLLRCHVKQDDNEPFRWHVPVASDLETIGEPNKTVVIDLKPKEHRSNLSLYEILDVWGLSDNNWTPVLLRLGGLFVDADPTNCDPCRFTKRLDDIDQPIYEFLYIQGSIKEGQLSGRWTAPPMSPTNGALLWPYALQYFAHCIDQTTPNVWKH